MPSQHRNDRFLCQGWREARRLNEQFLLLGHFCQRLQRGFHPGLKTPVSFLADQVYSFLQ